MRLTVVSLIVCKNNKENVHEEINEKNTEDEQKKSPHTQQTDDILLLCISSQVNEQKASTNYGAQEMC